MEGFIRAAAATIKISLADPWKNADKIIRTAEEAKEKGVKILVFSELSITGYTCSELFRQSRLIREAEQALLKIRDEAPEDMLIAAGAPILHQGKLYNTIVYIFSGRILGIVPKHFIPDYSEFYEGRYFAPGLETPVMHRIGGEEVPFGENILLENDNVPGLVIASEICEDLWVPEPPSIRHALNGATVILNASASNETAGKSAYRRQLVSGQSARLLAAYIYASAGEGESTQDLIFSGHDIIAENGTLLSESGLFSEGLTMADIDIDRLIAERARMTTFRIRNEEGYRRISFSFKSLGEGPVLREFDRYPFIPHDSHEKELRCEEILSMQAQGLKRRLEHTGSKTAVIGVSGGLDSTLALLVAARAFDMLGLPRSGIIGITMPCFGTSDRTHDNSVILMDEMGVQKREIDIRESVMKHFEDIGQDPELHDVTYENSQARERTQILMDLANMENGMVIGTGDMSELALGWCTYNGDHMSMYAVNAGVPKTLIRHLVRHCAESSDNERLKRALIDVIDTPVSPELLPPDSKGAIAQKTEDKIGPYELHDFFLYHMLRYGYGPKRIYEMAKMAFAGQYDEETIMKWLKTFFRRFFSQQFKRSCMPDGPKIGSVALSPRGDLRMPSDASAGIWLSELESLDPS